MTVSNSNNRTQLVADGTTTAFDFNFKIFSASELAVFVAGVVVVTGFTVSGIDQDSGGTVTFNQAPDNGASVVMLRDMDFTQQADYLDGDPFSPEVHEKQLDRQTMMIQQIREESDRAIKIPVDSTAAPEIDIELITAIDQNSDSYLALAQNIDSVNAVNANESDIQTVAGIAPNIDSISFSVRETVDAISLSLGATEIEGSVYTNLGDAINYAYTKLNIGGRLLLQVPFGTFDHGANLTDLNRDFELIVFGQGSANSILTGTTSLDLVDGAKASISGLKLINTAGSGTIRAITMSGASSAKVSNSIIAAEQTAAAMAVEMNGNNQLEIISSELNGGFSAIEARQHDNVISKNSKFRSKNTSVPPNNVVRATNLSIMTIDSTGSGTTVNSSNSASTGFYSDHGSTILFIGTPTFNDEIAGNIIQEYSPAIDTTGNQGANNIQG